MKIADLGFTGERAEVPEIHGEGVYEYQCIHCEGKTLIVILRNFEKVTLPTVEFCPLCGMSNEYPKEELEE